MYIRGYKGKKKRSIANDETHKNTLFVWLNGRKSVNLQVNKFIKR